MNSLQNSSYILSYLSYLSNLHLFQIIFNCIQQMQLETKPSKVTCWAKSTESKVTTFLDDYLINYPVKSVRQSTRNLLTSLFKKGTSIQKQNMLNLIKQRVNKLSAMGNSSSEFLMLIFSIFQGQVQNKEIQKKQIMSLILQKGQQILKHVISSEKYEFYSYLENTIQFSAPLQPYLVEASGCLKCYGKTQFVYEQKDCKEVVRQIKAHISQIELVFNRTYSVKDLKINLGKKKLVYKAVSIFYLDEKGQKKQLGGKYNVQETLPSLQFNGSALIFDFQFQKSKRHITCHLCGNSNSPDQYCFVCSVCFQKFVDIEGSFKVIGADPEKLSIELCGKYDDFNGRKSELEQMYEDIRNNKKTQFPNYTLIKEMQTVYSQIMKNLQLFKKNQQKKSSFQLKQSKECFSCNINQLECIIDYFKQNFEFSDQKAEITLKYFTNEQIGTLLERFIEFSSLNKLNRLQKKINYIIANLLLLRNSSSINYEEQLRKINSPRLSAEIIFQIIKIVKQKQRKLKEGDSFDFNWIQLGLYLNQTEYVREWTFEEKIKIFTAYFVKAEMNEILGMEVSLVEKQTLVDLNKLDAKQYKKLQKLIDFPIQSILKLPITTYIKLFLSLLPENLVPSYNFEISDSSYLKYIKTSAPTITDSFIFSNIVFSPNPIIKLNLFSTLPQLIPHLALEESMKLITSLVKYKQLWNLNLKQTLKIFQEQLSKEDIQKRLILSLEGYELSKQNMYLNKIYQILTPQRMSLIIRMEVPQADMQRQERLREGGPIQYIFLPVRQVKSQNLNGDTMRALHQWVRQQLKKMNQDLPFDLIVDKYIIDNLDLPIEAVYKKIAQKQVKKKIGSQQYDFLKVIYRMQGFFQNGNESSSSNPRDQNLESCLTYSSYLLTKIPTIHKTGLDVIMSILARIRKFESKQQRKKIFKLLQIISMNPSIIKKIIEWQYADLIINLTIKFFTLEEGQIKFSEVLLQICSKIIKQANQQMINLRKKSFTEGFGLRKQSDVLMDLEISNQEIQSESQKTVKFLLEKVKQCQQKGRKDLSQKMITLIPFCSKDQLNTSKYLFEFFDLTNTQISDLRTNKKLNWFLQFIQTLAQSYTSFKIFCRQNKFTDQVIANTLLYIQPLKLLQQKKPIKNLDILQLSLSIIKGLIRGDQILQKNLFDQNIIQQLYKISKLSENQLQAKSIKVGKVLTLSYEISKYFKEGHIVHPQVSDFIKGQQSDKIKKNQQKKKSKLLAMKQKNNIIAQKYEQQLMINQEEDNFTCSSCREGYTKKQEVIGIYIYSFKSETLATQGWWKQNKRQSGLTSVSYFTPIHFQCHMKAVEADQKIQKSEWEGALIRNSDVKCNGWIGVKGPKTTDDQYDRVNKKYFDKNSKLTGYWIVLNDLNGLLEKFSNEYNFSQQTKGSSFTHNCKLILVLMASTCHYMKKAGEELKILDQGVKYIEEHMTKRSHLLNLFFCVTLFTTTYGSYQKKKQKYFKLIDHLELSEFRQKKKLYIYLGLVNEIYCLIHVTLKDEQNLYEYLDKFIPENFGTLVTAFQKIAQKYKNVFLKWQNQSQIKQYFSIVN